MSEAEKEVLKTLKSGVGLTGAEQEILVNYIDKLQKENEESKELYDKLFNGYNKLVQEHLELEKTIDLMATELSRRPLMIYLDNERDDRLVILDNPKEIIKYYTKKAEEEK